MNCWLSNKKMQRTKLGSGEASPLIFVFDRQPRSKGQPVRHYVAAAFVALAVAQALSQEPADERPESEWRPRAERRILERLNASSSRKMKCEFVVNAPPQATPFVPSIPGKSTVLNFWRPSCGPCKPLLEELAAFSRTAPDDVVVLGAADGGSPYGQPIDPGKVREAIGGIVRQHGVPFPVCGYTDHAQTKAWQAEGVPLTLFFDRSGRITRVALGATECSSALKQLQAGWRP